MRILVVGIGAIGGVVAGGLARAGHAPVLLSRNVEIAEAIRREGIRVKTPDEQFVARADVYTRPDEVPSEAGPFDVAILVMKADAASKAAVGVLGLLGEDGAILTMQNGMMGDELAEAVGSDRVFSCSVGFSATMTAPGVYERTSAGNLHVGELRGPATERVRAIAAALDSVVPTRVEDDLPGVLWSKLAINAAITGTGALSGLTLGECLRHRRLRRAFAALYRETLDAATSIGVTPRKVAADPWLLYVPADAGLLTRAFKSLVFVVVGMRYADLKSSSLQSLERGRPTEVDEINGHVVRTARENGGAAPVNAALIELVHQIERGERRSGMESVAALATRL
jgi:2-dehydropantoate 2-reductase